MIGQRDREPEPENRYRTQINSTAAAAGWGPACVACGGGGGVAAAPMAMNRRQSVSSLGQGDSPAVAHEVDDGRWTTGSARATLQGAKPSGSRPASLRCEHRQSHVTT